MGLSRGNTANCESPKARRGQHAWGLCALCGWVTQEEGKQLSWGWRGEQGQYHAALRQGLKKSTTTWFVWTGLAHEEVLGDSYSPGWRPQRTGLGWQQCRGWLSVESTCLTSFHTKKRSSSLFIFLQCDRQKLGLQVALVHLALITRTESFPVFTCHFFF